MTYSNDLRLATIRFYNIHKNDTNFRVRQIYDIFNISLSTFYNWLNKYVSENDFIKTIRKPKISKITPEIKKYITKSFMKPKITSVINVIKNVRRIFSVKICKSYIYQIMKQEKITYKRVSHVKWPYTTKRLEKERIRLVNELGNINDQNIISFDECSVEINMQNNYGWSNKGHPCLRRFHPFRKRLSLALAVNRKGVVGYSLIANTFNGERFEKFLAENIFPTNNNKKILLDNFRAHKSKIVTESIKKTNNKFVFNIPYSPQTNPVEYIFSIIKRKLASKKVNNEHTLRKIISHIVENIPKKIFNNCFNKSFGLL